MIASIYLKEHPYLINKPQTINFGGKYLYTYAQKANSIIVKRKPNRKYIPGFFNISDSICRIDLLSAIVGQNGVGKSSILDVIKTVFISESYISPDIKSVVLVEIDGETKVIYSDYKDVRLIDSEVSDPTGQLLEAADKTQYQSIYYSPHFDLKYDNNFDNIDSYDISLDQFIKLDFENIEKKGTNERGMKFDLHEELVFKNSLRQIEFLNSSIFQTNIKEIFDIPMYETGILYFRDVKIPPLNNTPTLLRPIIQCILEKIEAENKNWRVVNNQKKNITLTDQRLSEEKYFLKRSITKAFVSVIIQQMEKDNDWLDEGRMEHSINVDNFKTQSARDVLITFIKESYLEKKNIRKPIFNYDQVKDFLEKIDFLIDNENEATNIGRLKIKLKLDGIKEILILHRKIIRDLVSYYPAVDGLIEKRNHTDGFISFRPSDRNMSSGENALLNFFSKLYHFIQTNLTTESKSLPYKKNYILLLDEADMGFHPDWKKKYVNSILKTIPYFFESLEVKPNLQIIITTHDPLTLSDFPINNVIFLKKDDKYCDVILDNDQNKIQKTFGANISDLLAHSFFVNNGLIGDFSKSKIKGTIDWINNSKESNNIKSISIFNEELEYYKKIIGLIDEKIVKIKLAEMITELAHDNTYYNQVIDEEIEFLKKQKK